MVKKISIIAGLLLVIGTIGSLITFSSIQKKADSFTTQLDDVQFNNVKLDVNNIDVELIPSQGEVKVDVSGTSAQKILNDLKIDQQDDTLILQSKQKRRKWFSFNIGFSSKIKLYLPKKEYETIELNTHSADLYLKNITGKDIVAETSNGDIVADNISANLLTTKTPNGDISLDKVTGDVQAKTTNGDIKLSNIKGKSIQAKSGNGDIVLHDVLGEIQAENNNGDITLKAQKITDPITAQAKSGDILMAAKEYPENVQFETATTVGDILIFGKNQQIINNQNPGVLLHLETTTGDIIVRKSK